MSFTLIKGTFHVRNYSPDGDSVRFAPLNPALFDRLTGSPARLNARGHVQLRIEAIDALETHYTPGGGGTIHQPLTLAHQATDFLLDFLQISEVVWSAGRSRITDARDGMPGYILARNVEKYGRPVAFVYAGKASGTDGRRVFLDVNRMKDSYNYAALAQGHAYPTYYTGLFYDLRAALTEAVVQARSNQSGLHGIDRTTSGFTVLSLKTITEEYAVLPKLFRRLSEYIISYGTVLGFKQKLAESQEPVLDLRCAHFTHFDTFVEQAEGSAEIRLTRLPEELVFDPMPLRPADTFARLLNEYRG
jgi:hypothetical protein